MAIIKGLNNSNYCTILYFLVIFATMSEKIRTFAENFAEVG